MKLPENLKVALYGGSPLYILVLLDKIAREPGLNKEDVLDLISKSVAYYENFDEDIA